MTLRDRLKAALSPSPRCEYPPLDGFAVSAVLVPVYERKGKPHVLFTERHAALKDHAGQVSFPGGRAEDCDPDAAATALREAREELGIAAKDCDLLGYLTEQLTPSRYLITPVVAWLPEPPALKPDPAEVAEAFDLPFSAFEDPACYKVLGLKHIAGRDHVVPEYKVDGRVIWGATGRIVQELLGCVARARPVASRKVRAKN